MCASGKVKYLATTGGGFTRFQEYDIIAFVSNTSGTASAVVIDDNGDVTTADAVAGSPFTVTELFASTKVI